MKTIFKLLATAFAAYGLVYLIGTYGSNADARPIEPEMVGEYMGELTRGVHIHEYTSSKGQECVVAYTAGGKVSISCN